MKTENQFIKEIQDRLEEIQNMIFEHKRDLSAIERQIDVLARLVSNYMEKPLYVEKNRKIERIMNHFLSKGLSIEDAMTLTSSRTGESLSRIESVYRIDKNQRHMIDMRAMVILIKKLLAARYTKKEIARITGYSEKYLYDLLNKKFN